MTIPVDYITFLPYPNYFETSYKNTLKLGYKVIPLTPDEYKVWKDKKTPMPKDQDFIRMGHAPFKHIKEITFPKLLSLKDEYRGFFIMEGDVIIDKKFTPDYFQQNFDLRRPYWLGYKKILKSKGEIDYIVGNFLLYFPSKSLEELGKYLNAKNNIFSDRFFTQLVKKGFIELSSISYATEIEHISGTTGKMRK